MNSQGITNPVYAGSTLSLSPGQLDNANADTTATSFEHSTFRPSSSSASTVLANEAIEIEKPFPQNEKFKTSWDNLDSYVERRKTMSRQVLTAKSSVDLDSLYGYDTKKRCKISGHCFTLTVLIMASLSMIGVIIGVVSAEVFIKRGYFTRGLRLKLDPLPEEILRTNTMEYDADDTDWLFDETTPMETLPKSTIGDNSTESTTEFFTSFNITTNLSTTTPTTLAADFTTIGPINLPTTTVNPRTTKLPIATVNALTTNLLATTVRTTNLSTTKINALTTELPTTTVNALTTDLPSTTVRTPTVILPITTINPKTTSQRTITLNTETADLPFTTLNKWTTKIATTTSSSSTASSEVTIDNAARGLIKLLNLPGPLRVIP